MDIEQLIFPFVMAVIFSSLMIVIIYLLRKIPYFANLLNVWFMVILYLFSVLRIFLPIEFPDIQIKLEDHTVYTAVFRQLIAYDDAHNYSYPSVLAWILIGVWIAGIMIIGIRSLTAQSSFRRRLFSNGDLTDEKDRALFSEVAREVLGSDRNVSLRKTDAIDRTIVIGLIRQTVLIPDKAYTEKELRMIFRHECMHIKDKDLWVKLLVQIYCCVFWWNPFAYLLKKDLDLSLEIKCDLNTTKAFSDEEKLFYVETLKNHSISQKQKNVPFVVSAELVDGKKKDRLLARIKKLLADPPNKAKQILVNTLAAILFLLISVSSFVFIWQPRYEISDIKDESYELDEDDTIIDESNAYLVKNKDGTYQFYYSDYPPVPVSKEEVEKGMYEGYPIYEK